MNGFLVPDECVKSYAVTFSLEIEDYLTALHYPTTIVKAEAKKKKRMIKFINKILSEEFNIFSRSMYVTLNRTTMQ